MALRFDEKLFLYYALMVFGGLFDLIHMIAISIWHRSNDLVAARSRVTKKHVRDEGNYFTDAELMHRLAPQGRSHANTPHRLRQKKGWN